MKKNVLYACAESNTRTMYRATQQVFECNMTQISSSSSLYHRIFNSFPSRSNVWCGKCSLCVWKASYTHFDEIILQQQQNTFICVSGSSNCGEEQASEWYKTTYFFFFFCNTFFQLWNIYKRNHSVSVLV